MEQANAVEYVTLVITGASLIISVLALIGLDSVRENIASLTEGIDSIKNKVARKTYYKKRPGNQS